MSRIPLAITLFFAAALHLPAQSLKEFRRVVVANDALPVQRAAAEELAGYTSHILGRKMEVTTLNDLASDAPGLSFFVGNAAATTALGQSPSPWKSEEWMLRSVPKGLAVAGDDADGDAWSLHTAAGSMLAVYTLLEDQLGVHWFWPGEFGEHVPQDPSAVVPPLDERRSPSFLIRSVSLGYNSVYRPKGTIKTDRTSSYHTAAFQDAEAKWARRSRLGWVQSAGFSHSWRSAFQTQKGETFQQHPDWFALVNGKRQPPQMCTTNPEVIEHMVDYVLKGRQDITEISPNDGSGFCECDRCRALDVPGVLSFDHKHVSLSDRMFTYANEVARRVRERNPNKGCGMIAYTFYSQPPVNIKALEPNLYLSFVFQSAAQRDPEYLRDWHSSVAGWQRLHAKMIVREGWGNHYYHDLPFLHEKQIIANLAEASRMGFVGAYGDGSKNLAAMAPNYWAITHMMWDPQRDTTNLMPEFFASAYGPVAHEMEAFFGAYDHALDANWSQRDHEVDTNGIAYANMLGAWSKLIPPAAVEEAEQHLREAEAKVPPGEYADRVKFHRLGQDYTRVMLELLENYRQLGALGLELEGFSRKSTPAGVGAVDRDALLRRTYELGEQREKLLLAHRDWAGPDEGLYAFNNDGKIRQWHAAVKKALGINQPTAINRETLMQPARR